MNRRLDRAETLDGQALTRHFRRQLLLPYILVDDLHPDEYARLLEQLPVTSALQVYTTTARHYPFNSAAAHTLGFVGLANLEDSPTVSLPGDELKTFAMKGSVGRDGLELYFDEILQGETGGTIYRVDPAGYRVNPPLVRRLPVQGRDLVTSLDIDLQIAAETALAKLELPASAVMLAVDSGEVLALATKPDFDLNATAPRIAAETYQQIDAAGGWYNRSVKGIYPPGSAFKILTAIAGLRAGTLDPEATVNCEGVYRVGRRLFPCHDGHAHGPIRLAQAIEVSCNVYFYEQGLRLGAERIAEGRTSLTQDSQTISSPPSPRSRPSTRRRGSRARGTASASGLRCSSTGVPITTINTSAWLMTFGSVEARKVFAARIRLITASESGSRNGILP